MTKPEHQSNAGPTLLRRSSFELPSSFVIRHASFRAQRDAFTLLELLVVMMIIIILAGLVLATASYVQTKGKRSRAEAEIAALSAALENYKADNGTYPKGNADGSTTTPSDTDQLDPKVDTNPKVAPIPNKYTRASVFLYKALSADTNGNGSIESTETGKTYFPFKAQMLDGTRDSQGNLTEVSYIRDPFGNSYGYSTAKASNPIGSAGYNPTFDLWSTTDETTASGASKWIKNW